MGIALRGMFFDDDTYYASDFVESNKNTYSDGILPNTEYFKVTATTGMTIAVTSGRGWVQGHSFVNSATATITLDNADGVLNRIDRIVVRLDNSKTDGQQISVEILKGTLSATPTATALTRNGTVYEIALADVLINAGTTTITTAMITDKRTDITVCGWAGAFSAGQLNYDALDLAKADKSVVDALTATVNGKANTADITGGTLKANADRLQGKSISATVPTEGQMYKLISGVLVPCFLEYARYEQSAYYSASNAYSYDHTITPPATFLGRKVKMRCTMPYNGYSLYVYVYKNGSLFATITSYQDFEMQITASDTWVIKIYSQSGTATGTVKTTLEMWG